MRLSPTTLLAVIALTASLAASAAALVGSIEPGVVADEPGGVVREVEPGGLAWDAGVRPGQKVELLRRADEPGGWVLETSDANGGHRVTIDAAEAALRLSAAAALTAVILSVLALPASRLRRRRAEFLCALAIVLAAAPVSLAYGGAAGIPLLLLAGIAPWAWIARWHALPRDLSLGLLAASVALGLAFVAVRLLDPVTWAGGHSIWEVEIVLAGLALVAVGAGVTPRRVAQTLAETRVTDAVAVIGAAIAVVVLAALHVPLLLIAPVVLLPLLAYARARTMVSRSLDRLLLAEIRERAALRATEEERARMSREIHDDPLQALAVVIRRLEEPEPDTAAARESLRDVAARLRGVATELHPPVLDDLGLAPAIAALARQVADLDVDMQVQNHAGYVRQERPPMDVELAIYRIVQEAVTNVVTHAGATRVTVGGEVAMTKVVLEVSDDGVGFDEARIEQAMREGRLGIASMQRRAAAIDAVLEYLPNRPRGTTVRVRWEA
jgi:signal transduction histidine kinase